jgi:energy-coupling factor transporter ATP-binding protein EcfA2
MKLRDVEVKLYRNVVDSNIFAIESDVTCLLGKNESGKTTLLHALSSLNPAHPEKIRVDITHDYPRWRKVRDEKGHDLEKVQLVTATFLLEESDFQALSESLAVELPASTVAVFTRNYAGAVSVSLQVAEADLILSLVEHVSLDEPTKKEVLETLNLEQLRDVVGSRRAVIDNKRTQEARDLSRLLELITEVSQVVNQEPPSTIQEELKSRLPKFFYFDQYDSLPGRIDLIDLLAKTKNSGITGSERTALSLLKLAGVEEGELSTIDFETRISELEAAGNEITNQVFSYWTQNPDLLVEFIGDSETVPTPNGQDVVHRFVDLRLRDLRHQMTTNFATRSTGFQWFFSFIAAFSEFEGDESIIILLDEPGLGLHARAQQDLLRYIDERLARNQVIYTTHSPFMLQPDHLERIRLVEDLTTRINPDIGSKITTDLFSVREDTLSPLQIILGYDLALHLFVGAHNLVVEGPSDKVYLLTLSYHLIALGREGLDQKWTIINVGGVDKIPSFIALFRGHLLDVTVLTDSTGSTGSAAGQRLDDMISRSLLQPQKLLRIGQITGKSASDIEDLFMESEYLELYNNAYNASITSSELVGNDSIVRRIERHIGAKFEHLTPADVLLRDKERYLGKFSSETLDRFEELFRLINATLAA